MFETIEVRALKIVREVTASAALTTKGESVARVGIVRAMRGQVTIRVQVGVIESNSVWVDVKDTAASEGRWMVRIARVRVSEVSVSTVRAGKRAWQVSVVAWVLRVEDGIEMGLGVVGVGVASS